MKKILVLFGLGVILTGCEKQAQETVLDELLAQKEAEVEKVYSNELIEKEVVNNNKESNEFDDWEIYTNEEITFKYPKGWFIRKDVKYNTIYISNKEWKDYSAGEYPEDFLGAWISYRKPSAGTSSYQEELELFNKPNMTEIISTNSMKINMREFSYNPKSERSGGGPYLNALWEKNSWIFSASTKDSDNKENNEMVVEIFKQILSTVEESDELGELKVYKNEKYGYSFKYPKNWYLYEYSDYKEKCPTENPDASEDAIVLSRKKLDDCEIVGDGGRNTPFGGDMFFVSIDKGGSVNPIDNLKNYTKPGDPQKFIFGNDIVSVRELDMKLGKELRNGTRVRFHVANNSYYMIVRYLENENDFDSEMNEILNSFVIE